MSDIDLTIGTGVMGLLGPNGAGKSTLLKIAASTLRPASGTVALDGKGIYKNLRAYRSQLGYLPQHFGFLPHFTVSEFVEYVAWLKLVPKSDRSEAVANAIDLASLADVANRRMKELSGGTLRRVGIAQAVVNEPAVLLLDEPTVGLDSQQRSHLREILRELGTRMIVVLATHLTEDVSALCQRVVIIKDGQIKFDGSRADLDKIGSTIAGQDTVLERAYTAVVSRAAPVNPT